MLNLASLSNIINYTYDENIDLTKGFESSPLDPRIANKINKTPVALSQVELDTLVNALNVCNFEKTLSPTVSCAQQTYILNQYQKLSLLQNSNSISSSSATNTPVTAVTAEVIPEENITFNGNSAIGTLILPLLYIRWGEIVLHNTFPSFNLDDNSPQIRDNVSSLEITLESASSGADSTGGSGSSAAGVSSCTLTLNPQLVDSQGKPLIINTDGAELLVIYGYGNSNQIRSHTFSQIGVKDQYFNNQQTTLSFRGIEWKINRLSEQKRYGGGKWIDKINEIALEVCKGLGYEDKENCIVKITPEGFGSEALIGETVQNTNPYQALTQVVEHSQGCKLTGGANSDPLSEDLHGKYTLSIDCSSSLEQELSTPAAVSLVDRALWLGQGLAEAIELSDVGDSASMAGNTGGSCGGSSVSVPQRPKNSILVDFTQACDYRVLRPNQIKNQSPGRSNEWVLELELNGSKAVPLLAPFSGTIINVNSTCKSTTLSDKTCNEGRGNSVTIKSDATEGRLKGLLWTFYYVSAVAVAVNSKVKSGDNLATQGSSGEPESELTGINIYNGTSILTLEESEPIINEFIQTITFSCAKIGGSCKLENFLTTADLGPGYGPYHLHLQVKEPSLTGAIQAFDTMSNADKSTCYNLNRAGNVGQSGVNACWDAAWDQKQKEEVSQACWDVHKRSPKYLAHYFCDYYIFDKPSDPKTAGPSGRFTPSAKKRPSYSPFPDMYHRFIDASGVGAAVTFFKDKDNAPNNTMGFGDDNGRVLAQILHGDLTQIRTKDKFVEIKDPCSSEQTINNGSSDTNLFLAAADKEEEQLAKDTATAITPEAPAAEATTTLCGKPGKYAATDQQLMALNKFCKANNCNPKDIAAFINAECSWNINAVNPDSNCAGLFQCCPGQGAEVAMKPKLHAKGETWFNNCSSLIGQPIERQLEAYKVYTEVSQGNPEFNNFCQLYTQIALPAFVDDIRENPNVLLTVACKKAGNLGDCSQFMRNAWFRGKTLETASLDGICKYGANSAIEDSRGILEGGCSFSGGSSTGLGTSGGGGAGDCSNSSDNRSLNSRNTGTLSSGGLQNLKFRQEIRLNAEFGVNPRNIFLSPTSVDGLPVYLLLANMDNSEGFVDFKIRSLTLSYNGSWRYNITAFRPSDSVDYSLPLTLPQPRSLNEWIEYYWYPDLATNGDQLAAPGVKASFNINNGTLANPVLEVGIDALSDQVRGAIDGFFKIVDDDFRGRPEEKSFEDATVTKLKDAIDNEETGILKLCRAKQAACSQVITDNLKRFNEGTELRRLVTEEDVSLEFGVWVKREMVDVLNASGEISAAATGGVF